MVIKVYVSCCGADKAVSVVEEAVKKAGVEAQIEVVNDLKELMKAGVMSPPAIGIDNRLVAGGRIPKVTDLVGILTEAAAKSA